MPEKHSEVHNGYRDMQGYKELVHLVPQDGQRMQAEHDQRHQSRNSGAIWIHGPIEIALERIQASLIPDWGYVEWYGMYQAQEEADVGCPSVQDIQSLMANSSDQRYEVGFRTECNYPWHHRDCEHSRTDSQWWRSKANTGVVQRLRYEAVECHEDQSCEYDEHCAWTGELELSFPVPQDRDRSIEDEPNKRKRVVERSKREVRQLFLGLLLRQLSVPREELS